MLRSILICCIWAIFPLPSAVADQQDPRLEDLFARLQAAPDLAAAAPLEAAIWGLWLTHDDPLRQQLMQTGSEQINAGALQEAAATFTRLIELTPQWAESWNKRATVYYLLGDYAKSELDIQRTLALEPFHFGALSGRGLVRMGLRDFEGARNAFSAALEVHPNMETVRNNLRQLDEYLRQRSI